jgi:predicted DNA-binding protein (MmcQ/YjbR family)
VTPNSLRRFLLDFAGSTEEFPFTEGTSVFKVAGKIFAITSLDDRPLKVSLKCEPAVAEQLRVSYPAIAPGYHLNKRHWNTVTLDGSLTDRMVRDLIEDSYDLVVAGLPRKEREKLDGD